jgi:hypothetical protein
MAASRPIASFGPAFRPPNSLLTLIVLRVLTLIVLTALTQSVLRVLTLIVLTALTQSVLRVLTLIVLTELTPIVLRVLTLIVLTLLTLIVLKVLIRRRIITDRQNTGTTTITRTPARLTPITLTATTIITA